MTLPRLVPLEKSLAVLALAGACGATGWWWQQQAGLRRLRAERGAVALTGSAYAPATLPVVESAAEPWTKPRAQAAGAAWIYELFTPPVIYYHASARSFAVFPPASFTESATQVFGVELLAVKREPFRLQLVGYVGTPGDYVGAFVSSQVPETLLARSGRRFAQLGLALKSLEVRKVDVSPQTPRALHDVAAVAVLQDERTGEDVTLDTRGPRLTDTPLAVFRLPGESKGKPRELHEGDTWQQGDATYRIERIQLDPPEVVVARQTPALPHPELRVLKPEGAAGGLAAGTAASAPRFEGTARPGLANRP